MNDNPLQILMFSHIAHAFGYADMDTWALANMADFISVSASLRMLCANYL